jgi:quercetin 2,3-dioxygenase
VVPEPHRFGTVGERYDVRFLPDHRWRTPSASEQRP